MRLHWEGSNALGALAEVELAAGPASVRHEVEWVRPGPGGVLLKLRGVDDRDAAQALAGASLLVPRSALPETAAGEFYLSDLVGAAVFGPEGRIGEVIEVRTHPSIDCVAVRLSDGRVLEQPLCEPWLEEVDLEAGRIVLSSTEGMM